MTIEDVGASGVNASTLKYQWTQSTTAPAESSFNTIFTNGGIITKSDGTGNNWYLWILAKDNLGNTVITKSNVFYIDNTPPTVTAPKATTTSRTLTATFVQSDSNSGINASTKQYSIKKTADTTWGAWVADAAATHQFTGLEKDTSYDVRTQAADNAGNGPTVSSVLTTSTKNITAPEITSAPTASTNGNVTVTIGYSEETYLTHQYYAKVNGDTQAKWYTAGANPITFTIAENQTIYAVSLEGTKIPDGTTTAAPSVNSGNTQISLTASHSVTNIDKLVPVVNEVTQNPVAATWTNGTVTITGKATDAVATTANGQSGIIAYQFSTNGSLTATSSGWTAITNTGSSQTTQTQTVTSNATWYFYVKDAAGNINKQSIAIGNIEIEKPTINVNPSSCTVSTNKSVIITASDTGGSELDPTNSYQYQLSTSNTTAPTGTWTTYTSGTAVTIGTGLNGTYYLWIKEIKDNAGNTSTQSGTKVSTYHVFGGYVFDNIKPIFTYVSKTNSSTGNTNNVKKSDTITITFKGTDTNLSTNSLSVGDITVKVGEITASPSTKTLSAGTISGGQIQYTLTLSGLSGDGALTLEIPGGKIADLAGNTNDATTLNPSIYIDNTPMYWEITDLTINRQ